MGRGDRAQPEGVPDGRAAVQPGREAARADARPRWRASSSSLGTTTVYVTHDQTEAMTLGDRVAIMRAASSSRSARRRSSTTPAQPVRRRLHRLAGDELPARDDHRRRGEAADGRRQAPQDVAERIGRRTRSKPLIAGVRPEDFEDAEARRRRTRRTRDDVPDQDSTSSRRWARSTTSTSRRATARSESAQVDDLLADQGGVAELAGPGRGRRGAPQRGVEREGGRADRRSGSTPPKLHFFDAESGNSLSAN